MKILEIVSEIRTAETSALLNNELRRIEDLVNANDEIAAFPKIYPGAQSPEDLCETEAQKYGYEKILTIAKRFSGTREPDR